MSVAARFYVAAVTLWAPGITGNVKMAPVTRGEANAAWSAATPSGSIEMTITNVPAFEWFKDRLGKELAIEFKDRPADETA